MCTRIQAFLLLLLGCVAWCQDPQSRDASQQSQLPHTIPPPQSLTAPVIQNVPGPVYGIDPPVMKGDEAPSNVIEGSLRLSVLYDDQLASGNTRPYHEYLYAVLPSIGIQQNRQRVQYGLGYTGGVDIVQGSGGETIVSQAASANIAFALTRHLVLRLREAYAISSDPFFQAGQTRLGPLPAGPGTLKFVGVPTGTRISDNSAVDLAWQIGPHTMFGMSGSYVTLHYRDVATGSGFAAQLIDTDSRNGRIYLARRISRSQSVGLESDVQDLWFGGGAARTTSQGAFAFDEITIHSSVALSLFAGSQRSHSHNTVLLSLSGPLQVTHGIRDQWSPAGGANLIWQTVRNTARLGIQHAVTDGGGLVGEALSSDIATAELVRNLTTTWAVSVNINYFDGRALVEASGVPRSSLRALYGGGRIEHKITENLSLRLEYQRIHQAQTAVLLPNFLGDHNRLQFGLNYGFRHPWGN